MNKNAKLMNYYTNGCNNKLEELDVDTPYALATPRTQIPESADLNDYTDPGTYWCRSFTIAQTLQNCPVKTAFKLVVDQCTSFSTQRIVCDSDRSNPNLYYRKQLDGIFGDWNAPVTEVGLSLVLSHKGYFEGDINSGNIEQGIYGIDTNLYPIENYPAEATKSYGIFIQLDYYRTQIIITSTEFIHRNRTGSPANWNAWI